MFWDNVAWVYDVFAYVINRKANKRLCDLIGGMITPSDNVLECACGTGMLSEVIAAKCKSLTATDFSEKMLERAERKNRKYRNAKFEKADITQLGYADEAFDVVVAANVIHLLDDPYAALRELDRVCRDGGRIIIPTYMNRTKKGDTNKVTGAIAKAGADFKREFTEETYKEFIAGAGYENVSYTFCDGKIPCAVAVIHKSDKTMKGSALK